MLRTTTIRLYPTTKQAETLAIQFGCARWVWNNALALNGELYRATGKGLMNYCTMAMRLPKLKSEFEWLKDADSQVLQHSLQNLARAFENFFAKRGGYPKFKSKHGKQAIQYPQRVKLDKSKIYAPKIGWIKCVMHRKITGKIKTVTISRSICGHFHACILAENGAPLPPISTSGNAIGIDLGVIDLAVTSNGSKYKNPKHLQRAETNLARKQRKFSRKKRGSKGRDKARQLVARVYERIACARKDYLHKLSRRIVNENQVIAVESLYVKGMTRNHKLAKSISDAGWSTLVKFLEYKAAEGGKAFIKCDRWYPSSKTCSNCGAVYTNLLLSVRTWECRNCGICHDRDINAARNICNEGLRIILAGGAPATASRGNVSRVVG